jgi:hypothetical protein
VTQPESQAKATPSAQETPADAVDLDEDLFQFDTLFHASKPLTEAPEKVDLAAMLEAHEAEVAAAEPAAPKAVDAPDAKPAAQAEAPHAPQTESATPRATSAPRVSVPTDIPESMWMAPMAAPGPEPKRNHLVEILALCFLVLNTALVLFAWRASDDFRDTLATVTHTVSDAVADGHNRGQSNTQHSAQNTQGSMGVRPDVNTSEVQTQSNPSDAPSELVLLPRATLDLAMERMAQGKFQEARQGLNHLLANQDRTALPEEWIVEAEALIAQSFATQAKEIQQ